MPVEEFQFVGDVRSLSFVETPSTAAMNLMQHEKVGQVAALRKLVGETGLKAGQIFSPIRTEITGERVALPLFVSLAALGQPASVARIRATIPQVPATTG